MEGKAHGNKGKRKGKHKGNFILSYGDYSGIFTSKGQEILVDTEDLPALTHYTWYLLDNGYASTRTMKDGRPSFISMHRLLMQPKEGFDVDHANGNRSDNRKVNLRIADRSHNMANIGLYKNNTSGYKGVSFCKRENAWRATIKKDGTLIYIGLFKCKHKAASAWNKTALELFREFAYQNPVP